MVDLRDQGMSEDLRELKLEDDSSTASEECDGQNKLIYTELSAMISLIKTMPPKKGNKPKKAKNSTKHKKANESSSSSTLNEEFNIIDNEEYHLTKLEEFNKSIEGIKQSEEYEAKKRLPSIYAMRAETNLKLKRFKQASKNGCKALKSKDDLTVDLIKTTRWVVIEAFVDQENIQRAEEEFEPFLNDKVKLTTEKQLYCLGMIFKHRRHYKISCNVFAAAKKLAEEESKGSTPSSDLKKLIIDIGSMYDLCYKESIEEDDCRMDVDKEKLKNVKLEDEKIEGGPNVHDIEEKEHADGINQTMNIEKEIVKNEEEEFYDEKIEEGANPLEKEHADDTSEPGFIDEECEMIEGAYKYWVDKTKVQCGVRSGYIEMLQCINGEFVQNKIECSILSVAATKFWVVLL